MLRLVVELELAVLPTEVVWRALDQIIQYALCGFTGFPQTGSTAIGPPNIATEDTNGYEAFETGHALATRLYPEFSFADLWRRRCASGSSESARWARTTRVCTPRSRTWSASRTRT